MSLRRIARHLLIPDWWAHRAFSKRTLDHIDAAVHESEKLHRGELCFALFGGTGLFDQIEQDLVLRGLLAVLDLNT